MGYLETQSANCKSVVNELRTIPATSCINLRSRINSSASTTMMILHPFIKPLSQAAPSIAASASSSSSSSIDLFLRLRGGADVVANSAHFDFDLAKTRLEGLSYGKHIRSNNYYFIELSSFCLFYSSNADSPPSLKKVL